MPQLQQQAEDSDFFFIERDEPESIQSTILQLAHRRSARNHRRQCAGPIRAHRAEEPLSRIARVWADGADAKVDLWNGRIEKRGKPEGYLNSVLKKREKARKILLINSVLN
jgi:hypothetical protein